MFSPGKCPLKKWDHLSFGALILCVQSVVNIPSQYMMPNEGQSLHVILCTSLFHLSFVTPQICDLFALASCPTLALNLLPNQLDE